MLTFRVLNEGLPDDLRTWLSLWDKWPEREVFAHPAYVKLFCREKDSAICVAQEEQNGAILFPLIKRAIEGEAWTNEKIGLFDLVGPYGYGGPYFWGNVDACNFWQSLDSWAKENEIVSLFTRLSLFPNQCLPFRGEVEEIAPNVVRTLDASITSLWMRYEHKVRKNVKRAIGEGVAVERDDSGRCIDEFLWVYHSTMERRSAKDLYRFPKDFFLSILSGLPSQFTFFHAIKGKKIISTELVLVSERHIYSFLGGTVEEAFAYRPNDLIKHEIIRWGLESGKSAFVLGGGYGGPDGIFRYKRSFAPDGIRPFYIGTRVWDEHLYAKLIDIRRAFETSSGREWTPPANFFPAYRA